MAKIFVDVGGHLGETVEAAVDPRYGFDRIYSFEPAAQCADRIRQIDDPRVIVVQAGLFSETKDADLFGVGTLGASVFRDAPDAVGGVERCRFIRASDWFREHIQPRDVVYVKLNCEGSECAILQDLIESGEFQKITEVMVDFDARKIPSQQARVEAVTSLLASTGRANYHFPEELMYHQVTHFGGIQNWLNRTGAVQRGVAPHARSLAFHVHHILGGRHHGFYKMKAIRFARRLSLRRRAE